MPEPGWLYRQFKSVKEESKAWPFWMKEATGGNTPYNGPAPTGLKPPASPLPPRDQPTMIDPRLPEFLCDLDTDVGPPKQATPQGILWLISWLRRLVGLDCRCGGEWGPWERKTDFLAKLPSHDEIIRAGRAGIDIDDIGKNRAWQERRCMACGKIQQEELDY